MQIEGAKLIFVMNFSVQISSSLPPEFLKLVSELEQELVCKGGLLNITISPSHSILAPGQPVPLLTL